MFIISICQQTSDKYIGNRYGGSIEATLVVRRATKNVIRNGGIDTTRGAVIDEPNLVQCLCS